MGEINNEFRKPNLQIAKSPNHFLNSWVLQGEACSDSEFSYNIVGSNYFVIKQF